MKLTMRKILITNKHLICIVWISFYSIVGFTQENQVPKRDYYEVCKIDNSNTDYYLVFLKNGQEKFTVKSAKTIVVKGEKIKEGGTYFFDLVRDDSLSNELDLISSTYPDIYFFENYTRKQLGTICSAANLKGLIIVDKIEITPVDSDKSISGIYTQQMFYRFIIVEFKSDRTFNYHIMSERAHRQTSGKYVINGETIILNSYQANSEFDFVNKNWTLLNKKRIVISENLNDKKENWSILERNKHLDSIPTQRSDLALKIDSIKINELSWIKDTTNYDSELKVIIREPLAPKEPVVIIDGVPVKYNFLLDYYTLSDIDSLNYVTGDKLIESGFHGGQAMNGVILITTKNKNRNANNVYTKWAKSQ